MLFSEILKWEKCACGIVENILNVTKAIIWEVSRLVINQGPDCLGSGPVCLLVLWLPVNYSLYPSLSIK